MRLYPRLSLRILSEFADVRFLKPEVFNNCYKAVFADGSGNIELSFLFIGKEISALPIQPLTLPSESETAKTVPHGPPPFILP